MPTARIVQISDTHLGAPEAKDGVWPEDGLAATVRSVAGLRPDLVLLTGDVTDHGGIEHYRRVVELLQPIGAPILATAGNHDDPDELRSFFGGEYDRMVGDWRVVMLDTTLPGEIHGEIELDRALRMLGPDIGWPPTLVAMHHPPISTSDRDWFQLIGGPELVSALARRTDVRLVLAGHLHDVYRVHLGGVTYVGAPSTWYSLEHVGQEYRRDDGECGALRVDLFTDGRFDVAVVPRDRRAVDAGTAAGAAAPARRARAEQRLFDRFVAVRWSDATAPTRGADTVWRATLDPDAGAVDVVNHATRADAAEALTADLLAHPDERVFVGVDFALGFPAGFAARLARGGAAHWRAVWAAIADELRDGGANDDNRYLAADRLNARAGMSPGPFWGRPADVVAASVGTTPPPTYFGLPEERIVDRALAERGHVVPSPWQLHGRGAAAASSLLGINVLWRLSEHPALARRIRVWPFDTGRDLLPTRGSAAAIVVAQVFPPAFDPDTTGGSLPEVAALAGVCTHLARLDSSGELGTRFAPELDLETARVVEREEGWILTP